MNSPSPPNSDSTPATSPPASTPNACVRFHLLAGWSFLLIYLTLGIILETLHGFKLGWYLNEENAVRRMMLTLSHTHGTLLGLINLAFAQAAFLLPYWNTKSQKLASRCLFSASVLLPAGFFLGGLFIYANNDPGVGIFLVPPAGLLLLIAVVVTVSSLRSQLPGNTATRSNQESSHPQ